MSNVAFPYRFDGRKRTASAKEAEHIRHLIYQTLFTTPGERVMRPSFGSGLMQLVFAPNSQDLGAATQMLVNGALQEWLADRIVVNDVQVELNDSKLVVVVDYVIRKTQERQTDRFEKDLP